MFCLFEDVIQRCFNNDDDDGDDDNLTYNVHSVIATKSYQTIIK